jgi:biotin--protein ligase
LHLSCAHITRVGSILSALRKLVVNGGTNDGPDIIRGEHDTFLLEAQGNPSSLKGLDADSLHRSADCDSLRGVDSIKTLMFYTETHPSNSSTPDFDHAIYYQSLGDFQRVRRKPSNNPFAKSPSEYGNTLIHSPLLSSTSTLLDKNYTLLPHLPTGTVVQATTQFAGRGRGTNVWLSPPGSLLFSVIVPHGLGISNNGRAPVVLVQYLAAMAVVQGVQQYGVGTSDAARWEAVAESVKLKWPNDIYARHPDFTATDGSEYVKIGGILVTTSYFGGHYTLVVGIGLNVNNEDGCPTTSILQIARRLGVNPVRPAPADTTTQDEVSNSTPEIETKISIERLQASILVALEDLHLQFCSNGWDRDIERMYYNMWLHTDQIVTLRLEDEEQQAGQQNKTYVPKERHGNEWRARIKGITSDQGMLIAEEILDENATPGQRPTRFELRSDMNSFDFMQGLVRKKL